METLSEHSKTTQLCDTVASQPQTGGAAWMRVKLGAYFHLSLESGAAPVNAGPGPRTSQAMARPRPSISL